VSNLLNFIALDEPSQEWCDIILSVPIEKRKDYSKTVSDNGYNIQIETQKLKKTYERMI